MPRAKKENISLNIRLAKEVSNRLNDYCEETGMTKTSVVERALSMYLDDHEKKKAILEAYNESENK